MWNGKMKALTFSYDDGVEQDIRLIEILDRYHLRGTFNLNPGLQSPEHTFQKGSVTVRHLPLAQLPEVYKLPGIPIPICIWSSWTTRACMRKSTAGRIPWNSSLAESCWVWHILTVPITIMWWMRCAKRAFVMPALPPRRKTLNCRRICCA